ncbi:hypothetical protein D7Y27_19295 [Corallococcus sp. AB004]|uniref:hypothetical protein n=1 Tax=Corallococcus exiguus TaxID=83462 RepID=UPI000EA0D6B5|nr:hypothetical protein [Corallococcus exiguus]NPC69332.1 hypothetical protein [Corallococcus exiguus]RKI41060.1 hypothetical protein D7Y27_19295 [Corallococcus sp. AB004]
MRLAIIAGLLSVGLFAGCGSVDMESRDVESQILTPCERECLAAYRTCSYQATTPEALQFCRDESNSCAAACFPYRAPAAEVTARSQRACERACFSQYDECFNQSTSPEQDAACEAQSNVCYARCQPSVASPVQAMRPPPCEYACDLAYTYCLRNSPTPAQCAPEREDCYSTCPSPAAR